MAISTASFMQGLGQLNSLVTRLVPRGNDTESGTSSILESHTLPIVFGTLGAVLALASIIIGVIQIRAMFMARHRSSSAGTDENSVELADVSRQDAESLAPS